MEKNIKNKWMVELIKICYDQTFEETEKSVHSGKNKYRLRNTTKEKMKKMSKGFDKLKSKGISLDTIISVYNNNNI